MKKLLWVILFIILPLFTFAQDGQKINAGLNMSFGSHYFDGKVHDPVSRDLGFGYEFNYLFFFGLELGFKGGVFCQKVEYENNITEKSIRDTYSGNYWAPFIAPKIYIPVSYSRKHDRSRYIFLENRFSFTRMNLNMNKIEGMTGNAHNNSIQYEIKAGYQFPIGDKWGIACWVGYNTFDIAKVKPEVIRFKNTTPIQIGVGLSYLVKRK